MGSQHVSAGRSYSDACYKLDASKKDKLLHHAKRGAYAEIQVFKLLEHIRTPESEMVQLLQLASMQPEELHVLMRILTSADRTPGALLATAVQLHLTPLSMRTEINWNTCTRFTTGIMRPTMTGRWTTSCQIQICALN